MADERGEELETTPRNAAHEPGDGTIVLAIWLVS